jgi:hypothetical protein
LIAATASAIKFSFIFAPFSFREYLRNFLILTSK